MLAQEPLGSFVLVLHSHIPYVLAHGRWPHGTDWLTEAAAESYLPLIETLHGLVEQGISPKTVIGVTPVLAEQLEHPDFVFEFITYLQAKIQVAESDEAGFASDGRFVLAETARRWRDRYARTLSTFRERCSCSIVGALKELQDGGHIEIITSAATHGYLPLLSRDASIRAQVKQGALAYEGHFGRKPRGFWLPECAYRPGYKWSPPTAAGGRTAEPCLRKGLEEFLGENGLDYFIVDRHTPRHSSGTPVYGDRFAPSKKSCDGLATQQPIVDADIGEHRAYWVQSCGQAGQVAAFVRDSRTAAQVWGASGSYPADMWYLEFHKKHAPGWLRYWRISGADVSREDKLPYEPDRVDERVQVHAEHFVGLVKDILREHRETFGEHGVVCAAYDTELFGHWWFEGPDWLRCTLALAARDPEIELVTGSEYLAANPPTQTVPIPEGSWGDGGCHSVWLNEATRWTWELVHEAEREMVDLASQLGRDGAAGRILKQAAREVLLLQSSDWQFNISIGTSRDYAESRIREHHANFKRLASLARTAAAGASLTEDDGDFLDGCEERDQLFGGIDPAWFRDD